MSKCKEVRVGVGKAYSGADFKTDIHKLLIVCAFRQGWGKYNPLSEGMVSGYLSLWCCWSFPG
jgi:hypothetical protein